MIKKSIVLAVLSAVSLVAHALHDVLSYALEGRIEDCRAALKERFGTLTERQEVLT